MRKVLLAGVGLVLLLVVAAVGYGRHLVGKLNTPAFHRAVLAQATATAGAEVRAKQMDLSLLSGVTLKGIAVANPAPFPGDFLAAEAFVLRYRLRPLLAGRLEVERLALERPRLSLVMDARGGFNYERLGGARRSGSPGSTPAAVAAPLRIVLRQLTVEDASVVMTDHTKARLLAVEDADLRSSFEVEGGIAQGSGTATIGTIDLAGLLFLRRVEAPLSMSKEAVRLAPIRGRVAGGTVQGELNVRLKGGFRYVASLEVTGANVKTLLAEAGSPAGVSGALAAKATFEGTGGLSTMKGRGQGTITDCRVEHGRTLGLLAGILQVPELASPTFDECRAEFTQSGARLATPVLRLVGRTVELTGDGSVSLTTDALDYRMTLALAPQLFAKVTRPEIRPAFRPRQDGFSTIDFRLYGTTLEPQTDLVSRIAMGAATEAAKDQLNRLFKKKIF
jgi:hypothetical protein